MSIDREQLFIESQDPTWIVNSRGLVVARTYRMGKTATAAEVASRIIACWNDAVTRNPGHRAEELQQLKERSAELYVKSQNEKNKRLHIERSLRKATELLAAAELKAKQSQELARLVLGEQSDRADYQKWNNNRQAALALARQILAKDENTNGAAV